MSERYGRRLFCAHLAAAAATCALPLRATGKPPFRIAALTLATAVPLATMRTFYADTLGFEVLAEDEGSIAFAAGRGILRFERSTGDAPHYHFAFNIPENLIVAAHDWQRERTGFILPPERLNDPGLPRAVVAFRNWNAHSIFFWDPAGNAVEYIARHDLDDAARDPSAFSVERIGEISEIGLVVDDVPTAADAVKASLSAASYRSASDAFHPVGTPYGLVLVMKRGNKMAFEQGRDRDVYPTAVRLVARPADERPLAGYPYRLLGDG